MADFRLRFEMGKLSKAKAHLKALAQRKLNTTTGQGLTEVNKRELDGTGYTLYHYGKSGDTYVKLAKRRKIADQILDFGTTIPNNSTEGGPGDMTRLMKVCKWDNTPGWAARRVKNSIKAAFPYLREGDCQFLMSVGGGHSQQPHTDAPAGFERMIDDDNVKMLHSHISSATPKYPLAVVVTFSQPSFLWIWERSHETIWMPDNKIGHGEVSVAKRVEIPPFSALIFRQDLVHAGSNYDSDNLRLHFSMELAETTYSRQPDTIFLVDEKYFVLPEEAR